MQAHVNHIRATHKLTVARDNGQHSLKLSALFISLRSKNLLLLIIMHDAVAVRLPNDQTHTSARDISVHLFCNVFSPLFFLLFLCSSSFKDKNQQIWRVEREKQKSMNEGAQKKTHFDGDRNPFDPRLSCWHRVNCLKSNKHVLSSVGLSTTTFVCRVTEAQKLKCENLHWISLKRMPITIEVTSHWFGYRFSLKIILVKNKHNFVDQTNGTSKRAKGEKKILFVFVLKFSFWTKSDVLRQWIFFPPSEKNGNWKINEESSVWNVANLNLICVSNRPKHSCAARVGCTPAIFTVRNRINLSH